MTTKEATWVKEIVQAELGELYSVDVLFSPIEEKVYLKTLKNSPINSDGVFTEKTKWEIEVAAMYSYIKQQRTDIVKKMAQRVKEQYAARAEKV